MEAKDKSAAPRVPQSNMFLQQAWVSRLRWVAGSIVLAGGLAEWTWIHWYGTGLRIAVLGVVILLYNCVFVALSRRMPRLPRAALRESLNVLVWTQIVADLICLTLLTAWTGDYDSPVRALFVLHMVFASVLLDRLQAFGVALAAIGLVEGTLVAVGRTPTATQLAIGAGWDITLPATVFLASRLVESLRRQRRRLLRQNRRIRDMSDRLRRQQQLMIHQEKMIAMGQMAAGVAHEVANPLASMDGLLQLLERRPEKISAENMARLREQVARIAGIVRQLTDFSHPGGEWREANLNDIVDKALEVLRFDRRLKRVTIDKKLDPAMPPMHLQPAALEQVIINMALNAGDAMDGVESPRLEIRTLREEGGVVLAISDNGTGIPEAVRNRIFEPFFTTKPVGKGTGLGLSISYSLVQKHEGHIEVKSQPHTGTTFEIHLPNRAETAGKTASPIA
jgi:C4-dicarboxylate-specific signal transduction histidine kinase